MLKNRLIKFIIFSLLITTTLFTRCNCNNDEPSPEDSLTEGLLAYYPFNNNIQDESGNGYHGSVLGAVPTADKKGDLNSALYFDGQDDQMTAPHLPLADGDFSLSFWIKLKGNKPSNNISLISQNYICDNGNLLDIRYNPNHSFIHFAIRSDGNAGISQNNANSDISIQWSALQEWNHITVVKGDGKTLIYLNGILSVSTSWLDSNKLVNISNNSPFGVGISPCKDASERASALYGSIDEIRVYSRQISSEEVNLLAK